MSDDSDLANFLRVQKEHEAQQRRDWEKLNTPSRPMEITIGAVFGVIGASMVILIAIMAIGLFILL